MSPSAILTATLPVYLTMVIGVLARRLGILPKEADLGIMNLCVKVLTPCLIMDRIIGNPALRDGGQVLLVTRRDWRWSTLRLRFPIRERLARVWLRT